ncbi:hypothetical protein [Streptomyces sp. V4I2]|nr:hypothetical protein [Streptomyces sp. V4I2]MDQ1045320.1 hypothetical protein [Streptomyces sp. V4I2]
MDDGFAAEDDILDDRGGRLGDVGSAVAVPRETTLAGLQSFEAAGPI